MLQLSMKPCKKEESHPSAPAKGGRSHGPWRPGLPILPRQAAAAQEHSTGHRPGPKRSAPHGNERRAGRGGARARDRSRSLLPRRGTGRAAPRCPSVPTPQHPAPGSFSCRYGAGPQQSSPSPAHTPRRPHFQRGVIHAWAPAQPPGPWSMAAACCSAAASGVGFFPPWSIIMLAIRGVWIRRDPF